MCNLHNQRKLNWNNWMRADEWESLVWSVQQARASAFSHTSLVVVEFGLQIWRNYSTFISPVEYIFFQHFISPRCLQPPVISEYLFSTTTSEKRSATTILVPIHQHSIHISIAIFSSFSGFTRRKRRKYLRASFWFAWGGEWVYQVPSRALKMKCCYMSLFFLANKLRNKATRTRSCLCRQTTGWST